MNKQLRNEPSPRKTTDERTRISQTDVPAYSLSKALKVPTAIADNYGKNPTKPLRVAEAMGLTPTSSGFRMMCGASIAYGLTEGGYNADVISLTPIGRKIVAPTDEGADLTAKREAVLKPRVVREFLTKYNDSKLPNDNIAVNVLEEMGVPRERAKETLDLILECARDVGFLRDVKGSQYVDLDSTALPTATNSDATSPEDSKDLDENPVQAATNPVIPVAKPPSNRVFITHGKNKEIVTQIKDCSRQSNG
jgi:hypothetical protein